MSACLMGLFVAGAFAAAPAEPQTGEAVLISGQRHDPTVKIIMSRELAPLIAVRRLRSENLIDKVVEALDESPLSVTGVRR